MYFTGHSLGGTLAAFLCGEVRDSKAELFNSGKGYNFDNVNTAYISQ